MIPEVSVIIPSYNHARFIEEAARSVLSQSGVRVELIVIDDGSADDSVERVRRLAAQDARVQVYTQANAGSHAAINRGLDMATAPWVAILNSDDVWETNRLERMLAHAFERGADFLFSDCRLIDANGVVIDDPSHWWNFSINRLRARVRRHGLIDGLLYGNLTVSTSNFLFRRELLSQVGTFRRFRYNLDWDYVLRCLDVEGVSVAFLDEPLLRYRLHGNNAILSGMPNAAAEAQLITRQVYRRRLRAPEGLLLSHHRHDRLLRRFLQARVADYRASLNAVEHDRDALAVLIQQRQVIIEAERRAADQFQHQLNATLTVQREEHEAVRTDLQARCQQLQVRLDEVYASSVAARADRDRGRCREVRMIEHLDGRDAPGSPPASKSRSLLQRIIRAVRSQRRINESMAYLSGGIPQGTVRHTPREMFPVTPLQPRIAVHLHIFYQDLAAELISDALRIPGLARIVITGPWRREDLESSLHPAIEAGVDLRVLVVPNRGKDIGGLVAAVQTGELLDSDLVLKLHSKKSHNPDSYFQAISALFGIRIQDGDQWRRELIGPLAGSDAQVRRILQLFNGDPAIGMAGARPFITDVADANVKLSRATYERFGVAQGLAFVAGTMFWVRSSLLKPLLDAVSLEEFSLDSREVEGGLEHIMERLLGALVLAEGFDIYGVEE